MEVSYRKEKVELTLMLREKLTMINISFFFILPYLEEGIRKPATPSPCYRSSQGLHLA